MVPSGKPSNAFVRYLQPGGSFNEQATGPSGLFVILNPAVMGESFTATAAGATAVGVGQSSDNLVYTLVLTLDP